jgi:phospholipid N-methyltransferase
MNSIYQQYYTKSNDIVKYMIDKLSPKPYSLILEPCAGDGVFIDALLKQENNVNIDVFELDPKEADKLKNSFSCYNNISIRNEDTLLYRDFINEKYNNKYDFVIANPPYGAWQDIEKRKILKKFYPKLYVKETYSTFLYLCLNLLRPGGRLVFITPDTYLNLHMHTYLRKYLLHNALIEEIAIFPSCFFPGVNFGYSKLSIITLTKCDNIISLYNNKINIINNLSDSSDLITKNNIQLTIVNQKDIMDNDNYALIYTDNKYYDNLLKYSSIRIGDIADCVTGIYTGNDKKYLKVKNHSIKNGKNYDIISEKEIYNDQSIIDINGIDNNASFIPIIKGGNTRYLKDDIWYINWKKDVVSFYKTNKKSRFQNSQYYFKQGLAVPMVSSNNITASLLNYRIFDQSIVGIFPKQEEHILYLLAFFNTNICTQLIRTINPSANNSANYIKKLPIKIPDQNTLYHVNNLVESILTLKKYNNDYTFIENEINNIFDVIFNENKEKNIVYNKQKELFA